MILNVSFIGGVQLRMAKWSINSGNEQELSLWQERPRQNTKHNSAPQICKYYALTNSQDFRKKQINDVKRFFNVQTYESRKSEEKM